MMKHSLSQLLLLKLKLLLPAAAGCNLQGKVCRHQQTDDSDGNDAKVDDFDSFESSRVQPTH